MGEQPQAAKEEQPRTPRRPSPRSPGQVIECGWCGQNVDVPARGRVPKWCSPVCRHRAWEQARAAASGRAAVEVRDRVVETVKTVTVVQHHTTEVPVPSRPASVPEFVDVLTDLTRRLDSGRVMTVTCPPSPPPSGTSWRRWRGGRRPPTGPGGEARVQPDRSGIQPRY